MKYIAVYSCILLFSIKSIFGQQATLVEVDKIKLETLNQEIPIIGSLRSKKITNIMAPVEGKIDNVYVEEGDLVNIGKLLAKIDNNNYKYLLDIAISNEVKATSNYEIAKLETFNNKLDLDRMLALKSSSAFNQSKYDKLNTLNDILKSKENVALSELNVSQDLKNIAKLNFNKSNIKALYSGVIEEKFIETGEFVSTGSKMFQLISYDQLEVVAEVPSFRTFNLSIGQNIRFSTTDGLELNGKVRAVGKKENSKTRTVKLFLDYDNRKNKLDRKLIVDENVNILIPISSNQSYLTVHKDAILKREGLSLAYVVIEKKVEIRTLKLGEAVGNRFVIINGVKENEITVIKGNERLRPGQSVSIK